MALKVIGKKKPVWMDFPGEDGVSFLIKPFTLSALGEVRSSVRRKVAVPVPGESGKEQLPSNPQMTPRNPFEIVEDVDDFELSQAIFLHVLQDWKGVEFVWDDDSLHTKDEEKAALFDEEAVRSFVVEQARKLGEEFNKGEKSDTKNSSSSQNG